MKKLLVVLAIGAFAACGTPAETPVEQAADSLVNVADSAADAIVDSANVAADSLKAAAENVADSVKAAVEAPAAQ